MLFKAKPSTTHYISNFNLRSQSSLPDGMFSKNTNLGKFWNVLQCKMLVFFMATLPILWPNGIGIIWTFGICFPFWYAVPRKIWQP
jgi:hypothetical protein